ncbi:hypothetical protein BO70DRAFT_229705 [Aspergillus heteromorphus CBS 117.55]|uniref:Secreted protein n=1 Tax=Aspergillus heteromorphus CBS 117.55 TaxID=1448321 RepID=A0A317WEE3_9EURO|nr:uncharacterized protein BO70DRAFT_229705 [Aspergillus heteromorphus CBS 117.55]PWY84866.1 hypothetical protein BO70DRAFT_229705 [Aspergillus heteromorphus CBS 117.55]
MGRTRPFFFFLPLSPVLLFNVCLVRKNNSPLARLPRPVLCSWESDAAGSPVGILAEFLYLMLRPFSRTRCLIDGFPDTLLMHVNKDYLTCPMGA